MEKLATPERLSRLIATALATLIAIYGHSWAAHEFGEGALPTLGTFAVLLVVFVVVAPIVELLLDRIGQLSLVRRTILRKDYIEGTWASVIRPTTVDPHTN